jgi:tetratricopeptide (TPR) repeat protein
MLSLPTTRLEQRLRDLDSELFGHYQTVLRVAQDLMARTYINFPTYTDHGVTHTHRVVQVMDDICPDSVRESLSAEELFALLAGGILHDIGMVTPTPLDPERADEVRAGHDVYGAEKILEAPERYGVPRIHRNAVATLVRHHRSSNIAEDVTDEPVGVGRMVRLRLLCALLRAGDELHLTEDRAPDVILHNLALPEGSVQHFVNCRSVTGIASEAPGSEVLRLQATVEDMVARRGVAKVVEKVNEELRRLHPVFREYGVPAYRVVARLNLRLLLPNLILLLLCEHPEGVTADELVEQLGEESMPVRDTLRSLGVKGLARVIEPGSGRFHAVHGDIALFEDVSARFLNTEDDLRFLRSPYAQQMIADVVLPWLCEGFSAAYNPAERATRLSVLQQSPTALHLTLSASQVGRTPSVVSRRLLLDQLLLSGLTSDVYVRPQIAEGLDIGAAVDELGRHVASRGEGFARLISRAWTYRNVPIEEMGHRMVEVMDPGLPDEAYNIEGQVSVEFPREPAFLSFPHLMVAASEEMVPFEVAAPQLRAVMASRRGESIIPEGYRPDQFTYYPGPRRPALPKPQIAYRVEQDPESGEWRVVTDERRTFDQAQFPLRFEVKDPGKFPTTGIRLVTNLGPISCRDLLESLRMDRELASGGTFSASIVHPETGATLGMLRLQSSILPAPEEDDNGYERIALLAHAEARLGEPITPPHFLTEEQARYLLDHRAELEQGDAETVCQCLDQVRALARVDFTRVRVVVLGDAGERIADWDPIIQPELLSLTFSTPTGELDPPTTERLRSERVVHEYWAAEDPAEVVRTILESGSEGIVDRPCYREGWVGLGQSDIAFVIEPPEEGYWGAVQEVIITVRRQPAHRHLLELGQEALQQGKHEKAVELFTKCIVTEPMLAIAHANIAYAFYGSNQLVPASRSALNSLSFPAQLTPLQQSDVLCLLGLIELHHGNLDTALGYYKQALEIPVREAIEKALGMIESKLPDNIDAPAARYAAGWLAAEQGNCERATAHLTEFLRLATPRHASHCQSAEEMLERARAGSPPSTESSESCPTSEERSDRGSAPAE